ncbi:glucose 1-dehydrogenase [Haladaptatus sp. GCM10025707]|uniref:glucose 1-dehydrogenase n=1 Tax=unclassified Haladaptatus TaxID=2622732 RepID=UPI0023E8F3E6|nr:MULTISPECIES: glucose 1-dehydrogenase [unclassified Haladaptatus]
MHAIAVRKGEQRPRLVERPKPEAGPGEALVRTLRVGVDGTDHEVLSGGHGGFPAGADSLVLGHEAVGVVETAPEDAALSAGDVVVPTVRRPPAVGESNAYFDRGEADMAPPGEYVERGIDGGDGFMAEYFTSHVEYLVPIPDHLAEFGFLVEPISITEKALELAAASRASFEWTPESALVLGNGSLGLLTLAMLSDYDSTYCLGKRDRPDPTIDIIEKLGATYIDSRETPVSEIPRAYEAMDLVYEATGYAKHAFETIEALAPNGVGALLGVPAGGWDFEVAGSDLHREFVLQNKALVGSVNSGRQHFEAATETLDSLPEWFCSDLVTGVYDLDSYEKAFRTDERTIKTAIEFDQL